MSKPKYSIPSMADISAITPNGYKLVSTFSGCGGTCLGFRMDGYKPLWANEFVPLAAETYRLNHPGTPVNTSDIRIVKAKDILDETGLKAGELDVFEGSPPCASFSMSGKRDKQWGKLESYSDVTQRTDDLFFEYIRIMRGLQPKVFMAENVAGLTAGKAKGYFKEILSEFKSSGYKVKCQQLNSQWLGVPQARIRNIFIGVRNDLEIEPVFPKPLPYYYILRDILPRQPLISKNPKQYIKADAGRYIKKYDQLELIQKGMPLPISQHTEWIKVGQGGSSDKYFNLHRASMDKPSPTIIASYNSVTHPTEARKFSITELRLISSFPEDFQLIGSYVKQWERIGRSVPPLMARAIAQTIRKGILDYAKSR